MNETKDVVNEIIEEWMREMEGKYNIESAPTGEARETWAYNGYNI